MSVTVTYNPQLSVAKVPSLGEDLAANPTLTHVISALNATYTGSTTVAVDEEWTDNRTLAGASETLDLTALTRAVLPTVDATGKKLQFLQIVAGAANNAAGLTFADGAANGYDVFGDASGQITMKPGQHVLLFGNDKIEDIDATHKTIDVSGTAADTYKIIMVFG